MTNSSRNEMTLMLRSSIYYILKFLLMVMSYIVNVRLHDSFCNLIAWAVIWILFEVLVLVAFLLIGIASFKRTSAEMRVEAGEYYEAGIHPWRKLFSRQIQRRSFRHSAKRWLTTAMAC